VSARGEEERKGETMLQEFKAFILRGNVVDLAVGIIIGAAFTAIVTSLVEDVIMPPIGLLLGGLDFANYYINLSGEPVASVAEAKKAGQPVIAYGMFINALIKLLLVGWAVFLLVKGVNKLHLGLAPPPASLSNEAKLLTEIRDLLKQR
jgi:large conductance mechanosensitive channel